MPKKPFQQLASRQKTRIYRACLELLAAHGFRHTTIKMMTRRLKVADGYLHYYFDGKEDLVRWTIERGMDEWLAHFRKHVEAKAPDDIFELFRITILQQIRFTRDRRDVFAAYMTVVNEPDFPLAAFLFDRIGVIDRIYLRAIERELARGTLRRDAPPELIAAIFDVMITRFQEFAWSADYDPLGVSTASEPEVERLIDQLVTLLRDGIAPPRAAPSAALT
jgi:AcrR family transcriptional regulator